MAVSKQPSIASETSSAEGLDEEQSSRGEAKWKRFHPFRVVRKIFRRRVKRQGTGEAAEASKKSWSTSELQSVQDIPSRCDNKWPHKERSQVNVYDVYNRLEDLRSIQHNNSHKDKYEAPSPPYKIGLSVSHDSIFSPESSNLVSSEELNRPQGSSLSMQHAGIKNMFKDELYSRVRARRDSDDDDVGLPHSPCTSPTTVDVLTQGLKPKSLKTCSAGSLASMGSSENDEDSAVASSSGNSSRMSLLDRRSLDFEGDPDLSQPVPLNHQAARHRIAVRPKRTHGLPQKRLKQVAASKLNTLPTTPEVTEYLKAETTTTTIMTSTASMHQISRLATVSSRENSASYGVLEKTLTESKSSTELSHSQFDRKASHMKLMSHSLVSSLQTSSQYVEEDMAKTEQEPMDYGTRLESEISTFGDSSEHISLEQQAIEQLQSSFAEYSEHEENAQLQYSVDDDHQQNDKDSFLQPFAAENEDWNVQKHSEKNLPQEPPLRVASLIKNIEQSDVEIKLAENITAVEESHTNIKVKDCLISNFDLNSFNILDATEKAVDSNGKAEDCHPVNDSSAEEVSSANKPIDLGFRMANVCFEEYKSNVTMNNNVSYVSKNIYDNDAASDEQSQMEREIRQQFQQQKIITKHKKSSGAMSDLGPEEESIMSDKCVSPITEKPSSNENSKISVLHHVSHDSSVHQEKITEACNLITVDETFNLSVQGFSNSVVSMEPDVPQRESWVSSFGVPSSASQSADVTVNSITSNIYSQKLTEDRVTISINSSELKSTIPEMQSNEVVSNSATVHPPKDSKDCIKPITAKPISNNKINTDEKIKKPEIKKKSPSPESHSRAPFTKNVNMSKKVSVEIVPFSQRMKEKAYQPLSFSNKGLVSEVPKANATVAVERNLSERRISPKGKDAEKSNNRHSFSGILPAELDPHIMNSCRDKKPTGKTDKLRCPVQIRIHKNRADEKGNSGEKPDVNRVGDEVQLPSEISKSPRELKQTHDLPKWEVKVQTASQTKETIVSQSEIKRALSDSKSIISKTCRSEENHDLGGSSSNDSQGSHSIPVSPVTEDGLSKNKENIRKPLRETPPSKDPEPELLRVFARRSIKQKHSDKDKTNDKGLVADDSPASESPSSLSSMEYSKDLESTSPVPTPALKLDVSEPTKSTSPEIIRKKSKSFSEKEKPSSQLSTPLKDANIHRRPSLKAISPEIPVVESENFHRRQRTASEPEVPVALPPATDIACLKNYQNNALETSMMLTCRSDHLQRTASMSISPSSTLSNGSSTAIRPDLDKGKENPDGPAPSWLQLAQQRRELREQRERLLIGSSTNSFLDASSKPSRSSKVWDMVNNFQKLQMT